MFSFFLENQTITDTLQTYIQRKLSPLGSPEYAYTV
ncbi:LuxR family transcriptional regulator, partial [Pantoea ananatis]